MQCDPKNLINIVLAIIALSLYILGSRRFYLGRHPYLRFLLLAVVVDAMTAVLASFGITPTTQLPYTDFVPWYSKLFLAHVVLASLGLFGFIGIMITLAVKGTHCPYPRLKRWQFHFLLPVWLVGEGIALVNALGKVFFQVRIYDHF